MRELLTDQEFKIFSKIIYDESGITFSESNRSVLDSRLKEKLREKELNSAMEYFNLCTQNREEMKNLLDSVTTNLTRFFRNQAHFDAFKNYVIPHVIENKKERGETNIKIWSAGCSTGEEPYSIAMMLKDILPSSFTFSIVASDISLKSLMVAQEGFYQGTKVQGVPEKYLNLYFVKKDEGYQICDDLKKSIRFDYHNLKNDSGLRNIDVVFCRNVLIYFDDAAQLVTVNRFWDAMAAKSYLFIGHSESLFGMDTKFEFLKTEWACLYQKTT